MSGKKREDSENIVKTRENQTG